ncbi:MAG: PQQ-binding-like beta-propeller repeat protein [Verrucomicrobia bacterium]|nr:PQQ-binding-like beta-propeller repeat protein [Verrucomicrobiota bacterium]
MINTYYSTFRRFLGLMLLLAAVAPARGADDWPQFRGPNGQGVAPSARPPLEFGPNQNLAWRTAVPPGHSSPCVVGQRIFLSSFENEKLECRAYDRVTGALLWSHRAPVEELESTHAFSNPAAPTPVADGERVVFYVGSFGLLCFDHAGTESWRRALPRQKSRGGYGSASSPILVGDRVIQVLDTDEGGSRLLAVNRSNGETLWESPRPMVSSGWSTPVLWERAGASEVIVLGSKRLAAYDPGSGAERWYLDGFPLEPVWIPVVSDGLLYAGGAGIGGRSAAKFDGFRWADAIELDRNGDGRLQKDEVPEDYRTTLRPELPEGHPGRLFPFPLKGFIDRIDADSNGEVTEAEWNGNLAGFEKLDAPALMAIGDRGPEEADSNRVRWRHARGIPEVPSPVAYQGKIYLVRDGGLLQCLDAKSGEVHYQERLGVAGGYTASPVAADGRVYLAAYSGTVVVVDGRGSEFRILARNVLGENITATPALVDDVIYVRTARHLYAFESASAGQVSSR